MLWEISRKNLMQIFLKSLLATSLNNSLKYANYAFIVYMCMQIKKLSHNIFSLHFSIDLSPSALFYKWNSVLTFCYLEYMLPLLLFTTVYSMSPILHFVAASHVIIFISLDVRPFGKNHFITFFNFLNSNNGTATTLDWSVNIWFGKWWQNDNF